MANLRITLDEHDIETALTDFMVKQFGLGGYTFNFPSYVLSSVNVEVKAPIQEKVKNEALQIPSRVPPPLSAFPSFNVGQATTTERPEGSGSESGEHSSTDSDLSPPEVCPF